MMFIIVMRPRTFGIFGIPLIGINAGKLGFLMSISAGECGKVIEDIEEGRLSVYERFLLDVSVMRSGKPHRFSPFMNDAVIARGTLSRMIPIEVWIEDELFSHYWADGLIVSTPTGSTAYNLSAGGPILSPTLPAMVITPICAHTLAVRPFVTDVHHRIRVRIDGDPQESALTIDGQENFRLQEGDEIFISLSETKIKLYEPHHKQFYQLLRKKLRWQV
ncbi:NAD(+)/NADH kinase [Thermospira aquatica]|uniref:NAD kinase n=2 Tax=Thermospira aquatica TaxID=2828656 RepID=A0AAX3BE21_9SPIR|nr:NAD(+)/NADH kinase [Thermospira aquatica]